MVGAVLQINATLHSNVLNLITSSFWVILLQCALYCIELPNHIYLTLEQDRSSSKI